jgi:hypothetical protein
MNERIIHMNPIKMRAITEDEEDRAEKAVAEALEMGVDTPSQELANSPHRDLVVRSRDSFAKHLGQLQKRIEDVHRSVFDSEKELALTVQMAQEKHHRISVQAERDLKEIKSLREAVLAAHTLLVNTGL